MALQFYEPSKCVALVKSFMKYQKDYICFAQEAGKNDFSRLDESSDKSAASAKIAGIDIQETIRSLAGSIAKSMSESSHRADTEGCPIIDPNRTIYNLETVDENIVKKMLKQKVIRETTTSSGEKIYLQARRNSCIFCGGKKCTHMRGTKIYREEENYFAVRHECISKNREFYGKAFYSLHFLDGKPWLKQSDTCFICGSKELQPPFNKELEKRGQKWSRCLHCGYM